jgi:hypothetical protein
MVGATVQQTAAGTAAAIAASTANLRVDSMAALMAVWKEAMMDHWMAEPVNCKEYCMDNMD